MKKILLSLTLLSAVIANDTYVVEAKGEFGKELAEKYSKEGGTEVNINKSDSAKSQTNNHKENKTLNFAKEQGEKLYIKNCLECHGEMGTKRSYATAKKLSKMSPEDIYVSFRAYVSDPSYGTSAGRVSMTPVASRITDIELGYIIAYLKDDTTYVWGSSKPKQNTNISRNPTSQGTYLK